MTPLFRFGILCMLLCTLSGCGVSHDQHEQVQKRLQLTEQKLALAQQDVNTLKNAMDEQEREVVAAEQKVQAKIVLLKKKQAELDAGSERPAIGKQDVLLDRVVNTNGLVIPPAAAQRGYTFINETNRTTLLWHDTPVWQATNTECEAAVAPDGRSAVWSMECYPYNNERPENDELTARYYLLWGARDGNKPVLLPPPRQSRGVGTDQRAMFESPRKHPKAKLTFDHPENLWVSCGGFQWDSTSAYVYFSSAFGCVSGWWQLKPGTRDVRFVDYGGQFWLVPQPKGADQVLIQGLRYEGPPAGVKNYSNCYLYTPEDIASPIFKESHVRKKPSPTWE